MVSNNLRPHTLDTETLNGIIEQIEGTEEPCPAMMKGSTKKKVKIGMNDLRLQQVNYA